MGHSSQQVASSYLSSSHPLYLYIHYSTHSVKRIMRSFRALCLLLAVAGAAVARQAPPSPVKPLKPPPKAVVDNRYSRLNTIDMMIAGGIATAMGDLAMHPIDTIKTVQQAAPAVRSNLQTRYRRFLSIHHHILLIVLAICYSCLAAAYYSLTRSLTGS